MSSSPPSVRRREATESRSPSRFCVEKTAEYHVERSFFDETYTAHVCEKHAWIPPVNRRAVFSMQFGKLAEKPQPATAFPLPTNEEVAGA